VPHLFSSPEISERNELERYERWSRRCALAATTTAATTAAETNEGGGVSGKQGMLDLFVTHILQKLLKTLRNKKEDAD
jgi:hypothetical protein